MIYSSLQPGLSCLSSLKLLTFAIEFCLVAFVFNAVRHLLGFLVRNRPRGVLHLLAWPLTALLIEMVVPDTMFSKIAWFAVPVVLIAWFLFNYVVWHKSRHPTLDQQWKIVRKVLRLLFRAQLTPHAIVLDIKRGGRLACSGWAAVRTTFFAQ